QHPGGEARRGGVLRGRPDAVVGGDAHHVHLGHAAGAQPLLQALPALGGALEAAVGRGVGALAEHLLGVGGVQARVERGPRGARHAVRRPAVGVGGLVGEVVGRVEVVVAGGHLPVVVAPVLGEERGDGARGVRTSPHPEAAPLAEVVLQVHADQRLHGGFSSHTPTRCSKRVGRAGSPLDICWAAAGSSATERACRSRAAASGSVPTISPRSTSRRSSGRVNGRCGGSWSKTTSAVAVPASSKARAAHLRPPLLGLPTDRLASGSSGAAGSAPCERATSLYTSEAVGAPDPVTSEVPTP